MAKYWWGAADAPVASGVPAGWTNRFATSATHEVITDATSPEGRSWRIVTTAQARRFLSFDAVSADADRAGAVVALLVKYTPISSNAGGIGGGVRGAGAVSSETMLIGGLQRADGDQRGLTLQYNAGTATFLKTASTNQNHTLTTGEWFWLVLDPNGTDPLVTIRHVSAPATVVHAQPVNDSAATVTAAGWVGLFNFANSMTWNVAAFAVATGADDIFFEDPNASTPVAFTGTVPTLNGTEGAAFSESVASYFSGTETPFSYAVHAGTLPAGLTLNTSTGVISGTPTTAGTSSGIVIRATDVTPNTADTNSFSITIAAADTTAPVLTLPTGTTTGTTTASGTVTTDEANGTLYAVVTTSATPPLAADIRAGTGTAYATSQVVSATGIQTVAATGLTASTLYYWHFLHDDAAANVSNIVTSGSFTTDAAASVVKGVRVTTSAVSVAGLTAMWWDSNPPTGNPVFSTATASTDGAGLLELNLNATTALDVAQHGTIVLYKLDGTDHRDSLGAVSRLTVEDIA